MIKHKIGVLGGMGPEATILLQSRLVQSVEARDDADHIRLLIDMNPQVPSRISWLLEGQGADPAPVLAGMARSLESAGAVALVMPCNTAHTFAPDIQGTTNIPFMHMPELAAARFGKLLPVGAAVGVLASPATQKIGLFDTALAQHGLKTVYPDDDATLLNAIKHIKARGPDLASIAALQKSADMLAALGVDAILVGCSEFSLIAAEIMVDVPVIDTLDVLVDNIVQFSGAKQKVSEFSSLETAD